MKTKILTKFSGKKKKDTLSALLENNKKKNINWIGIRLRFWQKKIIIGNTDQKKWIHYNTQVTFCVRNTNVRRFRVFRKRFYSFWKFLTQGKGVSPN